MLKVSCVTIIGPQLFHLHASEVVVCIGLKYYFCRRQTITLELDLYTQRVTNTACMHATFFASPAAETVFRCSIHALSQCRVYAGISLVHIYLDLLLYRVSRPTLRCVLLTPPGSCIAHGVTDCSCSSNCDAGGCYCDPTCVSLGDCCNDFLLVCNPGGPQPILPGPGKQNDKCSSIYYESRW